MKKIINWLKDYFIAADKRILVLSSCFMLTGIFINYYFHVNGILQTYKEGYQFVSWFSIFFLAFSFPYLLQAAFKKIYLFRNTQFLLLLLIAPAIFAWKMAAKIPLHLSKNAYENAYWNSIIYYPLKLAVVVLALLIIWRIFDRNHAFYGLSTRNFEVKPYWIMLLIMVPLIAAASTQPDFLQVYPKLKDLLFFSHQQNSGLYKLLYELSYGCDFLTIELFFRGFLVLAFSKWAGKDAILPMALFYCTIHFGKPLGECISSFFGGILLGVVTYHTKSIYGGLIVHLGIAWLMELGGYLGRNFILSS